MVVLLHAFFEPHNLLQAKEQTSVATKSADFILFSGIDQQQLIFKIKRTNGKKRLRLLPELSRI